jgi:importin-5
LQSQDGTPEQLAIKKVYAMYLFELLAEYHLPQD